MSDYIERKAASDRGRPVFKRADGRVVIYADMECNQCPICRSKAVEKHGDIYKWWLCRNCGSSWEVELRGDTDKRAGDAEKLR